MHPQPEDLVAYMNGSLPESQAEFVEGHLQSCPECEATLNMMSGKSDTMIEKLRRGPLPVKSVGETECNNMVRAIQDIDPDKTVPEKLTSIPEPEPATPDLGQLREYKLLEILGQGGMGAVYRALHTRLDKIIALKVLSKNCLQKSDSLIRFEREIEAVSNCGIPTSSPPWMPAKPMAPTTW